jgi:hypothetical protein
MATRKMKKYAEGKMVYEDDEPSLPSGRTQMSDPYEDAAEVNRARAEAEGAKISEGERISNMPASPKAAKSKIVTKEELAKSGLSLRDYMNKQQGLTRRGDSAPAARASAPMSTTDTGDESARLASRYKKPPLRQETMRERAEAYNRKRGIPGYKTGGSVSSASKRADGIAIKGKTRGKMC